MAHSTLSNHGFVGALGAFLVFGTAQAQEATTATGNSAAPEPVPSAVDGQREAFAQSLMNERDYFRAITVWKELRFSTREPQKRMQYALSIASAYRRSNRFSSALNMLPHVLNLDGAPENMRTEMSLIGAESYLGLKTPMQAQVLLENTAPAPGSRFAAKRDLLLGVVQADINEFDAAAARFHTLSLVPSPYQELARALEQRARGAKDMPHRSPFAAALLSGILPGAGQAYTGHWVDAAQALLLVGAFGFTSFIAYSYERERDRPFVLTTISLSLTTILHIGNIIGAERTARYFNQRQRDVYVDGIRTQALSVQ
jgi:hypothetical protein